MGEKILIVDDEPFIVTALRMVLERAGFEVHSVADGDDALAAVRALRPAICLLDVTLRERSGYEVCEQIKQDEDLASTYVILLTAMQKESARARGMRAGADEYLTKPFDPADLLQRIGEVLGTADPAA